MKIRTSLLALSVATLGLFAAGNPARAAGFETLPDLVGNNNVFNDADYGLYANGTNRTFTSKYVFSTRIGDPGAAEWEAGVFESNYQSNGSYTNTIINGSQRQHTWVKKAPVTFSLEYTGSKFIYKVGNLNSIEFNINPTKGPITDLMIRTAAGFRSASGTTGTTRSEIELGSLNLSVGGKPKDTAFLESLYARPTSGNGQRDVDYLRVKGLGNKAFTLTGTIMMDWDGTRPLRDEVAMQIKAGSTPVPVPEPGTIGAMALAGAAIVGYRKRKQPKPSAN